MEITWPEPHPPTQLTRVAIEDVLGILRNDSENFNITRYPCLLMTLESGPIYFGDTLLINQMDGTPIALARQVYKRHIMSITNSEVADRLVGQVDWLRQRAQTTGGNEAVHPVYLMFPESAFYSLALSGNSHRDIRYVVNGDEERLQSLQELRAELSRHVEARIAAINLVLSNRPADFEGFPA